MALILALVQVITTFFFFFFLVKNPISIGSLYRICGIICEGGSWQLFFFVSTAKGTSREDFWTGIAEYLYCGICRVEAGRASKSAAMIRGGGGGRGRERVRTQGHLPLRIRICYSNRIVNIWMPEGGAFYRKSYIVYDTTLYCIRLTGSPPLWCW